MRPYEIANIGNCKGKCTTVIQWKNIADKAFRRIISMATTEQRLNEEIMLMKNTAIDTLLSPCTKYALSAVDLQEE